MRRRGFSLIELLVVITIIALLAGLAIPAVMNSLNSAKEFAIKTQVVQLETAIETFKTDNGFYPTDFYYDNYSPSTVNKIPVLADSAAGNAQMLNMLRVEFGEILRKLAPNHREFIVDPLSKKAPIVVWYRQIGQYLGPHNALSFWLGGGVSESKSHPFSILTRGASESIEGYQERIAEIAARAKYDFGGDLGRDEVYQSDADVAAMVATFGSVPRFLQVPMQKSVPAPIVYFRDGSKTSVNQLLAYQFLPTPSRPIGNGMKKYVLDAGTKRFVQPYFFRENRSTGEVTHFAPKKYQIIAPGLDGKYGEGSLVPGGVLTESGQTEKGLRKIQRDNITNFAGGRLDTLEDAELIGL